VEKSEKRKDAQTARDIDVALPIELDRQEQVALMREYIQQNFVDKGMCVDFAIHDKKDGNPHAHILLTTRNVSEGGFGKKNREWNSKSYLQEWRENWATACNRRLREVEHHIDHRTLKAQGIDREPTIHMGHEAWNMEKKGIRTKRGDRNRAIIARNESRKPERIAEHMHELREQHFLLDNEITELQKLTAQASQEMNIARAKAEDLSERAEYIEILKNQLEELQAERRSMSIFQNKKAIDEQIQRTQKDYDYAAEYFEYAYKIKPEHAGEEIERLEKIAESKKHLKDRLQSKLTSLIEEQDKTVLQYQRCKIYADLSHDKQKIYDRLSELEQQSRPHKQSAQYVIMREKNQRLLDSVSEQNLQKIMQKLNPEQRKALDDLREVERVRTFARYR
jgi:hypothetical protein